MANPEHLAILEQGAPAWNAWRKEARVAKPDLTSADLSGADLSGADLTGTNLSGANLSNARVRADLSGADLSGADLSYANLIGASLFMANLTRANLACTNFIAASLFGVNLTEADFSRSHFGWTVLSAVDLRQAKGLETVRHSMPSTIGIDTVYQSHGQIPEVFLRGCGVPDSFIVYSKSLVNNPTEFYSCFISYSSKDQAFADRLYADLQAHGVRCWFAPHDAQSGQKLLEQIDEAIRLHEKLLLLLSLHSMTSEWVKTEIAKARKREIRERAQILFPVSLVPFKKIRDWQCFDADTGKDSAKEIREYLIGDFHKWENHDAYQTEFTKLLRDLQSRKPVPASP